MRFLKLLLNIGLIVNALQTITANNLNMEDDFFSLFNHSLENFVEPLQYNIELTLCSDVSFRTFNGKSKINIKLNNPTRIININAYKLDIMKNMSMLIQEDAKGQIFIYPVYNHINHEYKQIISLYFADVIQPGHYTLCMQYIISTDSKNGLVRTKYINADGKTIWLFSTNLKPSMARRIFPCWDEQPELKSIFNISIKHPDSYTALSNMPILHRINEEPGMKWTLFCLTPKISPTQVAIALFKQFFLLHSVYPVTNIWCRPQAVFKMVHAHDIAIKIGQHIGNVYSSIPRKFTEIGYVAIPSFPHEAAVGWGLTIFREQYLEYHETLNLADHKLDVSMIVASQMAQQRFDLINPSSWMHLWLNNGLANILGLNILSKVYDDSQMIPLIFYKIQQQARHYKYLSNTHNILRKNKYHIYDYPHNILKESVIIRMLESIINKDVLNDGIIKYFQKHSFDFATIDDLWAVLQEVLNDSMILPPTYYIKEVMDTWITQDYYPVVTVTRNYDTGDTIITQKCAYENDSKWWIPLNYITQKKPNTVSFIPPWLRPTDPNVTINTINRFGWIIVNFEYTGFYRVNYDYTNWLRIAGYLKNKNFEIIPELSRAHMIDDAYYFLKKGQIEPIIFFELTEYLKHETSYVPWYALKHILSELWPIFKLHESEYLKNHLLNITDVILEKLGYEDQIVEEETTKLIRFFATKLACRLGGTNCRKIAKTKLETFVNYTIQFSPWWEKWVYCNGMRDASMLTWTSLLKKYSSTQNHEILEYLTYSEDTNIIIYYLNLIPSIESQRFYFMELNEKDKYAILSFIIKKHATNSLVLHHILSNFGDLINSRYPASILIDIIQNLYTTEQFNKIIQFSKDINMSQYDLDVIQENVQQRLTHITKLKVLANLFKEENR